MKKILTVIVPSYNTEKYIDECLPYLIDERIINEIEILIVNDGSKDKTVEVAQAWADKYPDSIRVVNKENGGHGSTINRGIQEARGAYFKVVDGDDWVTTDNFVKLVEWLKENDVDLINNPYLEHDEVTGEETLMMELQITSGEIHNHHTIIEQIKIPPMHTITYRTSILKDNAIRIDEKMFYVDVEYITYPLPFVNKSVYLDFPVYVYRVNSGSQSMAIGNMVKNRKMHLTMLRHVYDYIQTLPTGTPASITKVLKQRFSEIVFAQYVINLSIPVKEERKVETKEFTDYLLTNRINQDIDILGISKLLIKTNGSILKPGVAVRNIMQENRVWRDIERFLLTTLKKLKK